MRIRRTTIGLSALAAILTLSMAASAHAAEPDDAWFAFYVSDGKAGYLHITMTEGKEDGKTVWTTASEVRFSLARLGMPMTIVQKETVVEDENGQVLRFATSVEQGGPPQETTGVVADGKISIVQMGTERVVAYPEGAIGPAAVQRKLLEEPPKAGAKVTVVAFSSQAPDQRVVSTTTVGELEKVDVLGRVAMLRKFTETNTLLPVETRTWTNEKGELLVIEMDMGMGPFRILRTEKEIALADSEPVEVFTTTFVEPNRPIAKPRGLRRAVYRIGNKDGSTPTMYEGEGQSFTVLADGKLKVEVLADLSPADAGIYSLPVTAEGFEKYLSPTPYVESDDPRVVELAEEALGDEINALKAAALIEKFVQEKISEKNLSVGFASAAEVAKTLEGDCTEHAVLCCAIARAKGLPARVAMGLVYLPPEGGVEKRWANGFFGYHMWAEVLVAKDRWLPIDAAIGTYDATHLALAKSDLSSLNPGLDMMISMLKAFGSLTIEVIEP